MRVKGVEMSIEKIEDLYVTHARFILNYLVKMGCSKENAEDIVQNTFSKAIELMIHLEVDNVKAWLFKVSLNQHYDVYRRNKRFPKVSVEDEHFLASFVDEEDGEFRLLQKEKATSISDTLEQLKPAAKNLLLLKYEMDMSYEEISQVLNIKVETIRTSLYRARNEFKEKWRNHHERTE